jgi:methionyl-tRNA formyltransferase
VRIVFMGTSEFAVPAMLETLLSGHTLVAVYTRAPAASGRRGLELKKTPVHVAAESIGVPVFTPSSLRTAEADGIFNAHAADVAVVAAYGLLLPISILQAPRLGCINLHGSLLPRWRGAAPIQRAIMAGDKQTGVDVIRMDVGLDTGPIAMREVTPIRPDETAGDLTSRLSAVAAKSATNTLRLLEVGTLKFREQPSEGVSYAHKIKKIEADIDWKQSAETVRNQIHGLSPWPGAFSKARIGNHEEQVKFLRAKVATGTGLPGTLLTQGMRIACGEGAVEIIQAQRPGKSSMTASEIMRGVKFTPGMTFMES